MSQVYPIQRSLWESLDAILFSKGMALAKDIAAELNLPAKPLIASLNTQERGKFLLIPDEEGHLYQCSALIKSGAVWMRCRCPNLKPAPSICSAHEKKSVLDMPGLRSVKRLIADGKTYIVENKQVYTVNGEQCGILNGSRLILFEIIP